MEATRRTGRWAQAGRRQASPRSVKGIARFSFTGQARTAPSQRTNVPPLRSHQSLSVHQNGRQEANDMSYQMVEGAEKETGRLRQPPPRGGEVPAPSPAWGGENWSESVIMSKSFPPTIVSGRAAVAFVADQLVGHPDPWLLPRAVTLAQEVIYDAVMHARCGFEVTVGVKDDACFVAVADQDQSLLVPARRQAGGSGLGGGGTRLLSRLSAAWGTDARPEGKVVWFVVGKRPAARPPRVEPAPERAAGCGLGQTCAPRATVWTTTPTEVGASRQAAGRG